MPSRFSRALRDLSLHAKTTLTLVLVFAGSLAAVLLFLVPFLQQQGRQLIEQDKQLLATLRHTYEREFIYDLLSQNEASLAIHLGDLAGRERIVWARVEGEGLDLAATREPITVRRLVGPPADRFAEESRRVLVVRGDGQALLAGAGGRPLLEGLRVRVERLPAAETAGAEAYSEGNWGGQSVLLYRAELAAPGERFGSLQILYSLAPLEQSQRTARRLFYVGLSASFLAALAMLNLLLSRLVLVPVRRVRDAMARASTGDLEMRLPVHSRDEVGTMAEAFNRMVGELAASRREVESYSRDLEGKVAARTEALRASEARLLKLKNHLATVIASVGTGVVALDESGRVETVNERAGEILGIAPDEAAGRPLSEVVSGGTDGRLLDLVRRVLEGREPRQEAQVVTRRDGRRCVLSVVVSALPGEGGGRGGAVVVCEDLTQILASQRLEAWKEAVERVIHEIKNPLTPVGLAAQTLRSAHGKDRERFEELFPSAIDLILKAVRDLKELITEFSRFSRLPEVRLKRHDPNTLVLEALGPYSQAPPAGIEVRVELDRKAPEVEADADELRRVLLNVINNALEAMEGRGGTLTLRTRPEDGGVAIEVQDQGPGVEDVERIFEPHYTTKVKGTGLGLAIARQIIEEHGGRIHVTSALGSGATVHIYLPAAAPETLTVPGPTA